MHRLRINYSDPSNVETMLCVGATEHFERLVDEATESLCQIVRDAPDGLTTLYFYAKAVSDLRWLNDFGSVEIKYEYWHNRTASDFLAYLLLSAVQAWNDGDQSEIPETEEAKIFIGETLKVSFRDTDFPE